MRLLILVLIILLAISCEIEGDLPIKDGYQKKMALTGVLVPGREAVVALTASVPPDTIASNMPISNATVRLYEGNTLLGSFLHDSVGNYSLATTITEGKTYTLKVSAEGFTDIEASTTIPINYAPKIATRNFNFKDEHFFELLITTPPMAENAYYCVHLSNIVKYLPWSPDTAIRIRYEPKNIEEFYNKSFDFLQLLWSMGLILCL